MRKLVVVAAVLVGSLLLMRCGGGGEDDANNPDAGAADAAVGESPDSGAAGDAGPTPGPDAGSPDTGGAPCDPVTNAGCTGSLKCTVINAQNEVGCASAGTKGDYETCTSDAECKAGFLCAGVGGSTRECHRYCETAQDCPQAGGAEVCGAQLPNSEILLCVRLDSCDPLLQDCAAAGEACYPNGTIGVCAPGGSVKAGDPCVNANDCVEGAACFGTTGGAKCLTLCNPAGGAPACTTGTCGAVPGTNVGACQ